MIREYRDEDTAGVVRLTRSLYPESVRTEAGFRHRLATEPARAQRRTWCAETSGEIVGWSVAALETYSSTEGLSYVVVGVREDARGRGVGGALYEQADAHLRALGARRIHAGARDEPGSRRFAESRGFRHTRTERLSRVDPCEVDVTPLEALTRAKAEEGFRLVPLSEVRDRPESVFELDAATTRDVPHDEPIDDLRFDEWLASFWRHPDVTFEGSFIVLDGDLPVALTLLRADPAQGRALHDMTGTLPDYRGRGLARLVKLATIAWAAANGISTLMTENDETNRPMLALNESLGYRPFASGLAYVRDVP